LQLSGFAADISTINRIVENYGPGCICGIKHLLFDGNIGQRSMLVARSEVEMLEFTVACTHDEFYNLLKAQPAAYVPTLLLLVPRTSHLFLVAIFALVQSCLDPVHRISEQSLCLAANAVVH